MSPVRRDLPSGAVTFLFTDVEGSTKLLHELGAAGYAEALAEHRRILRQAFGAHGGIEVDTQGDAFFVAFPTAQGALEAAAEGLEGLASGPIRVRMGIHTGTPHLAEEGYVGQDVHKGARIAASGHGGQVLLSQETRGLVAVEVTDLGEHRLKDFAEPVWIFQLGRERFPPLKTISNTNLPRPASSFVGREKELEQVVSLLRDGARLLTLTGPGGSGKTRLAIEAAAELVPESRNGVFWVGLAPLRDSALVTDTIAETLGAKDGLADHIGERELLLLLDNLEQVVQAAPELSSLVEACPNLKLLVTSRELLRVRGEVEYPVLPLAEPEAVNLFCARARAEPDETVHELCRALDNLPLALELAAARASVLSPKKILERISKRLDLLRGGRDADPRQETLRATLEWSYELLDEEERRLFARMAVFGGGCTLEAAEEVTEADLDTLQSLVDKSLLRHTDERFWMLETIREYAGERLEGSGQAEGLRRRHAEYFLGLAERAEQELWGTEQPIWLERLKAEEANLRSALARSAAWGESELMPRLTAAVTPFWLYRGHFREAGQWLEPSLEVASKEATPLRMRLLRSSARLALAQGDWDQAAAFASEELGVSEELNDTDGVALALDYLSIAAIEQGDFEEAETLLERSESVAREAADPRGLARTTLRRGNLAFDRGDLGLATRLFDEARSRSSELGDEDLVAHCSGNLGLVALQKGEHAEAKALLQESCARFRRVGRKEGVAYCLEGLAAVAVKEGEPTGATVLLGAAEALEDELALTLDPFARRMHDETAAMARAAMSRESLASAWSQGQAMTLDEAVEYALGATD